MDAADARRLSVVMRRDDEFVPFASIRIERQQGVSALPAGCSQESMRALGDDLATAPCDDAKRVEFALVIDRCDGCDSSAARDNPITDDDVADRASRPVGHRDRRVLAQRFPVLWWNRDARAHPLAACDALEHVERGSEMKRRDELRRDARDEVGERLRAERLTSLEFRDNLSESSARRFRQRRLRRRGVASLLRGGHRRSVR